MFHHSNEVKESNRRQINKYAWALWHFLCAAVRAVWLTVSEHKFTLIPPSFSQPNKYIIRYLVKKMLFRAYGHLSLMQNTIWKNRANLQYLLLSLRGVGVFGVFWSLALTGLLFQTFNNTVQTKCSDSLKTHHWPQGPVSPTSVVPQRSDLFWALAPPFT